MMKKVIIISIFILNLFVTYSQIVCFNHVGWYGETPGHPKFNNDSIVVQATFENNDKDIRILGLTYKKKLPGYKLYFSVRDTYNHYLHVDSIVFNIYSATSKSILQSTLVEYNQFNRSYNRNCSVVYLEKVYFVDSLKNCKEDLLIDFVLYLRTKGNEQRMIMYSRYKMEYDRNSGMFFYL